MMQLYHNWKEILTRAWSIRLISLALLMSFLESILPAIHDAGWLSFIPEWLFSILLILVIIAAFVSRIVYQRGI